MTSMKKLSWRGFRRHLVEFLKRDVTSSLSKSFLMTFVSGSSSVSSITISSISVVDEIDKFVDFFIVFEVDDFDSSTKSWNFSSLSNSSLNSLLYWLTDGSSITICKFNFKISGDKRLFFVDGLLTSGSCSTFRLVESWEWCRCNFCLLDAVSPFSHARRPEMWKQKTQLLIMWRRFKIVSIFGYSFKLVMIRCFSQKVFGIQIYYKEISKVTSLSW